MQSPTLHLFMITEALRFEDGNKFKDKDNLHDAHHHPSSPAFLPRKLHSTKRATREISGSE